MIKVIPRWLEPAPDSAVARMRRQGRSPWFNTVHLLWSVWIFVTPVFGGGFDWRWVAFTLATYPLFLVLFALTQVRPHRLVIHIALAMAAMCLLLLPWYPASLSYFVYGCVMLHVCRYRLSTHVALLLGLNVLLAAETLLLHYPWQMIVWIPVVTLTIGLVTHTESRAAEQGEALRLSQDEVRRLAATAERERIGRDLHDLLGHTLSLITLKLELSRKLIERDVDAARREIAEAERVARHALSEVRSAVTGIRAASLAAELASARLMLESGGTHLEYELPTLDLPADMECGLSLVLREAVTNIARHARASRAAIELSVGDDAVELTVTDNGRGGIAGDGNGLAGMRERVAALHGGMDLQSPRGQGTTLRVHVPLKRKRRTQTDGGDRPSGADRGQGRVPRTLDGLA